ncbi:MAG: hypothetical protein R3F60_24200 [bacterium]
MARPDRADGAAPPGPDVGRPRPPRDASVPDPPRPDCGCVDVEDASPVDADPTDAGSPDRDERARDPRCMGFQGDLPACNGDNAGLLCARAECPADWYNVFYECDGERWQNAGQDGFDCPGDPPDQGP